MSILKTLTDTTFDSVEGYRRAAEKAEDPNLKSFMFSQADKRERLVTKLNSELERRGEPLVTKGTVTGDLHRLWTDVTDLFENGNEAATERVEEGEDYLAGKFEAALKNSDLDDECRPIIQAAYDEIKQDERIADQLEKKYD